MKQEYSEYKHYDTPPSGSYNSAFRREMQMQTYT